MSKFPVKRSPLSNLKGVLWDSTLGRMRIITKLSVTTTATTTVAVTTTFNTKEVKI